MIRTSTRLLFAILLTLASTTVAFAQANDDTALKPAEPDFTIINLPTSLNLGVLKSDIRITHRFVRPLKCDSCPNSLVSDAFGIDQGALIGLEFRVGVFKNTQVIVHRARFNKTIQFLGEYAVTRQHEGMPVEISALLGVEGTENFTGVYSPSVGAVITHLFADKAAIHLDPIWSNNTNISSCSPGVQGCEPTGTDNTFMLGIGGRVQFMRTLYATAEVTPRLSGYKPGDAVVAFAIEKRLGGHMFQLNFSNSNLTTTLGQLAQGNTGATGLGGTTEWYMGFNITRKFF